MTRLAQELEGLTVALQKSAAESRAGHATSMPKQFAAEDLQTPKEILEFVQSAQRYAERTWDVSVGMY